MASRKLLRRLPLALAAATFTLLAAGALGGWATAASADVPESFQLAQRKAGDQGTWSFQSGALAEAHAEAEVQDGQDGQEQGSEEERPSEHRLDFEWLEESAWRDAEGAWHAVHGLLTVDPDGGLTTSVNGRTVETPGWSIRWVETATGQVLGRTGLAGGGASASSLLAGGEEILSVYTMATWTPEPGCRLAEALREGVKLSRPIPVEGCAAGALEFQAEGVDTVQGVEAVRFVAEAEGGRIAYWFNPGIPEPIRVVEEMETEDGVQRSERVLESFEAGDGAWDTGLELPEDTELPEVALAPRQPWGPDDSGVDHPFPLSEAWERAAADPAFREFAEFLAAHPDAAAVQAGYLEEARGSEVARSWDVLVQSSDGAYSLEAIQREQPAGSALTDRLGLPPAGPAVTTYEFLGSHPSVSGYPLPDALPKELPTVRSALDYWSALGLEGEANAWGLFFCFTGCEGGVAVQAGRVHRDIPPETLTGGAGEASLQHSLAAFAPDGTPLYLWEVEEDYRRSTGLPVAGGLSGASTVSGRHAVAMQQGALAPWALPIPAAAGAGLLALLAAALAMLWPLLKGAPFLGLFSRLHGDRLLEHPVRARIAAAIEAQPGIHYQELLRRVGGGKGALEHHLRKLEEARLVHAVRSGRYTCYFPASTRGPVRATLPALKSEGARRILDAVQSRPGLSGQELAACTGLSPSTVSIHVSKLSSVGLVQTTRTGRVVHVQATPLAQEALAL